MVGSSHQLVARPWLILYMKTWLIVKEGLYTEAASTFQGTVVQLHEGRRFLGGALGYTDPCMYA